REPDLVRAKVARHIAMVGNLAARGNTTRYAEFNAWCDPEALDAVFRAELSTEMVGIDVTREAVLGPQEVTRLAHSSSPLARWIHDALRFYVEFHKQAEGLDGCIVNDVLPIAALIRPEALEFEEQRLVVDLGKEEGEGKGKAGAGEDQRGRTRAQPDGARAARAAAGSQPAAGGTGRRLGDRGDQRGAHRQAEAVRRPRASGSAPSAAHELVERAAPDGAVRTLSPSRPLPGGASPQPAGAHPARRARPRRAHIGGQRRTGA